VILVGSAEQTHTLEREDELAPVGG
jgi:hypothetical protein